MDIVRPGTRINFMSYRKVAFTLSGILVALSLVLLVTVGLNYGIDFAGGTVVQVKFGTTTTTDDVRQALKPAGLDQSLIQSVGDAAENEFLIRTPAMEDQSHEDLSVTIEKALDAKAGKENVEIRRVEMVGSAVSKDLKQKGFLSLFYAGIGILIYIWWRFELKFSFGAIIALVHDVLITLGIFTLTGREMSLPVVAALLTIIGYSLNDTIVVFDRIRENMKKKSSRDFASLIDVSISQTLSRTLLTSLTTFLVVLCLYLFGGTVINDFAFAMLVGVIVGTYSSIFIASPMLLAMTKE